jgi:hypothetical protein
MKLRPSVRRSAKRQAEAENPKRSPELGGASAQANPELRRRRGELEAQLTEIQWDLGGIAYEMASRKSIDVKGLSRRGIELRLVDSELTEVEEKIRMQESGIAGYCQSCRAPHSSGAAFCWRCGVPLLEQVSDPRLTASDA